MMQRFGVAVKGIIECDLGFLVLKKTKQESQQDVTRNRYDLPGGRVEHGEELISALIREIKEETNLMIKKKYIRLVDAKNIIRLDGLQITVLYYHCYCNQNEIVISQEHESYQWLSRTTINQNMELPSWIKEVLSSSYL